MRIRVNCSKANKGSYVPDLTRDMILTLAVTAPALQAPALRDAICKHVSFRPSIRVQIPVSH